MKQYPIPKATAVAVMLAFAGTSGLAVAAEEPRRYRGCYS